MIAALMDDEDRPEAKEVLFILEPANIEKLKLGLPVRKNLRDFLPELNVDVTIMLAYTPDIVFLGKQLTEGKGLREAMVSAMGRPEVFNRELDPEALRKQEIKAL